MPARKVKGICSKCKQPPKEGHARIGKHLLCFPCWHVWQAHSTALFIAELDRWVEQEA